MKNQEWDFKVDCNPNHVYEIRMVLGMKQVELERLSKRNRTTLSRVEFYDPAKPEYLKKNKFINDAGSFIEDTTAVDISTALGKPPEEVFEKYQEAKARAVPKIKLFANVQERNTAIEQLLPEIDRFVQAHKRGFSRYFGEEDMMDIAYDVVMNIIDRAMTRGLPQGCNLEAYIKKAILLQWRKEIRKRKKEIVRLGGCADSDGEIIFDFLTPQQEKALRTGNVPDEVFQRVTARKEYRELIGEVAKIKQLIRALGL